jgi:drug/metabolite transporter (DMT)-like permease
MGSRTLVTPAAATDHDARRAIAWMACCALSWAVLDASLVFLHGSYSAVQIVWWRYAAHLVMVGVVWGVRGKLQWRTKRPLHNFARAMLMVIMPGSYTLALYSGAPADGVWAVFWVTPLLIVALGAMFLREIPSAIVVVLAILGAIGACIFFWRLPAMPPVAIALALAQAAAFSLYVVMTRDLRHEPVSSNLLYTAAPIFLVLSPFVPGVFTLPDFHDAIILTFIGIAGFACLYALDRACEAAPAWASSNLLFLEAVASVAMLSLTAQSAPGLRTIIGAGVLIGVIVVQWTSSNRAATRSLGLGEVKAL